MTAFFSNAEKPAEDITLSLFLMFMNGLRDKQYKPYKVQIFNKVCQIAIESAVGCGCTQLDEQHSPLMTRSEKPSEDITWRLFLMNMKGLRDKQYKP
jgi:hypothetical protein